MCFFTCDITELRGALLIVKDKQYWYIFSYDNIDISKINLDIYESINL